MEDKTPIYSILDGGSYSMLPERRCLTWTSLSLSGLSFLAAALALLLATQQAARVGDVEARLLQGDDRLKLLEARLDRLAEFKGFMDDYYDDNDELEDGEEAGYYTDDDITMQRVLGRRKRDIPVVESGYAVKSKDFSKARPLADKLRLYEELAQSSELSWKSTEDPIKPHHRVSSTWSRREEERARKEKSMHNKSSAKKNQMVRRSRVKSTDTSTTPSPNSVFLPPLPQLVNQVPLPQVVEQTPVRIVQEGRAETTIGSKNLASRSRPPSTSTPLNRMNKRRGLKRPNKKHTRRSRRTALTVAHYVASNNTADDGPTHKGWSSSPWMDKLGLNRKYQLSEGKVTVKEPGLYYIYAQILYENSRFGTGFQIVVDDIPVLQCTLAPSQPANSCHTSGATYLPRNAEVVIRDLENYMTPVVREENSFFGLIKLLDAPATAEALILG